MVSIGDVGTERIGVGIVGTGFAASAHVDALSRLPNAVVMGLVGSSPDRARAVADRLGVERVYPDVDALLDDASVDAVHNCTPNDVHADVTLRALSAGKHVLSEKPLALDSTETARLLEGAVAGAGDVVTGVCFNYRHFPLVQQMRSMIAAAEGGRPHLVHGSYLQDWLLRRDDWNWRLSSSRAGRTRAIGDIGSHWVDTAEHVIGDPVVEVMADLGRLHDERVRPSGEVQTFARAGDAATVYHVDTEDFGSVLLRFGSGARGSFLVSQVSPGRKNRLWLEIDTADESFAWNQEAPNALWIGHRDRADAELMRDPALLAPAVAPLARFPGGHQEGWPDALRNLVADFCAAVEARRRGVDHDATFATFADGHHVMQVVEAIAESDRTRSWIAVGGAAEPGVIEQEEGR
jgi:predicted dehydrogenase